MFVKTNPRPTNCARGCHQYHIEKQNNPESYIYYTSGNNLCGVLQQQVVSYYIRPCVKQLNLSPCIVYTREKFYATRLVRKAATKQTNKRERGVNKNPDPPASTSPPPHLVVQIITKAVATRCLGASATTAKSRVFAPVTGDSPCCCCCWDSSDISASKKRQRKPNALNAVIAM